MKFSVIYVQNGVIINHIGNSFLGIPPRKMEIKVSPKKFRMGIAKYRNGYFIQDAFPFLTAEQREFMISGTTNEDWEIFEKWGAA